MVTLRRHTTGDQEAKAATGLPQGPWCNSALSLPATLPPRGVKCAPYEGGLARMVSQAGGTALCPITFVTRGLSGVAGIRVGSK